MTVADLIKELEKLPSKNEIEILSSFRDKWYIVSIYRDKSFACIDIIRKER